MDSLPELRRLRSVLEKWRPLIEMETYQQSNTGHATLPGSIGTTYAFTRGGEPFDREQLEQALSSVTSDLGFVLTAIASLLDRLEAAENAPTKTDLATEAVTLAARLRMCEEQCEAAEARLAALSRTNWGRAALAKLGDAP